MNDILLTATLDPMIADGDLAVGESLGQTEQLLLLTAKGEWKQTPTAGVSLVNYIESHDESGMCREIREQLERDGIRVRSLSIEDGRLNIDASWK